MLPDIREYLDEVRSHLYLDSAAERQIIQELETYFEQKTADLRDFGLSADEAARVAIRCCGRPRIIAQRMQEAYGTRGWGAALLACLPHLLVAGLFASHQWRHPLITTLIFTCVGGVAFYAWLHGRSRWVYPWLGYMLLLLIVGLYASYPVLETAALSLFYDGVSGPSVWLVLGVASACALSIWFITHVTLSVVTRDWSLASLMFLPLPFVASWLYSVEQAGGLASGGASLYLWDTRMCIVLVIFGLTSAVFVHFRERALKIGALIAVGVVAGTMACRNVWDGLGLVGVAVTSLLLLFFMLSPAVLESRIDHSRQRRGIATR